MSIFASHTKKTIALPTDLPHTATIRKLTGAEYERAQAVHATGLAAGRGWAHKFRSEIARGLATDAQVTAAIADPLMGFDRRTVVAAGLTGWSYQDGEGETAKPKPVTPEAVADIDDETLELLATEILKLTKPALFAPGDEARETARKNGSRPSTAH